MTRSHPTEHPPFEYLIQGFNDAQIERLRAAWRLAEDAAAKDTLIRPRGVDVALILRGLGADCECLVVALLSDPYLRENLPEGAIRQQFGAATAELVDKANWLNTFTDYREAALREPEQAELLRRMLLAIVNDVRAVLIKLAYRLQRLRLLRHDDTPLRRNLAQETQDLIAPLANRLGIAQLKWELEDLSFRFLHPDDYAELKRHLAETRGSRETYVHQFIAELQGLLDEEGVQAKLDGRPKHIYSIWKKMQRKRVAFDELYDVRAVRVTVRNTAECYAVLGMVHGRWPHVPKEFDDYIANPKPNGYRSLHTVVVGPEGKTVEVQIRTQEMHAFAEFGVAAHWRYKEGGGSDAALDRSIALLRGLLENRDDDHTLLENFRQEALGQDVFVLTPKQRILRLPMGATPLDFAYAIHTEVGHRCRGAKVNGRMVPLTTVLKSGEQVEIITTKQGGPSRHWLEPSAGFLKSAAARAKVRQWFKQQDHERNWRQGKGILERERQRLKLKDVDQAALLARFPHKRWEDFLAAVGRVEITPAQLAFALTPPDHEAHAPPRKPAKPAKTNSTGICIPGVPHPLVHFARCCQPQPGNPVIGYISQNRGVAVHRRDCKNITGLSADQHARLIEAYWQGSEAPRTDIVVHAHDRRGLLRDLTQILSHQHLDIVSAVTHSDTASGIAMLRITVEHADPSALAAALRAAQRLEGVVSADSH